MTAKEALELFKQASQAAEDARQAWVDASKAESEVQRNS